MYGEICIGGVTIQTEHGFAKSLVRRNGKPIDEDCLNYFKKYLLNEEIGKGLNVEQIIDSDESDSQCRKTLFNELQADSNELSVISMKNLKRTRISKAKKHNALGRKFSKLESKSFKNSLDVDVLNRQLHDFVATEGDMEVDFCETNRGQIKLSTLTFLRSFKAKNRCESRLIQKLASLYSLKASEKNSGKRNKIVVVRSTQYTRMPDAEALIAIKQFVLDYKEEFTPIKKDAEINSGNGSIYLLKAISKYFNFADIKIVGSSLNQKKSINFVSPCTIVDGNIVENERIDDFIVSSTIMPSKKSQVQASLAASDRESNLVLSDDQLLNFDLILNLNGPSRPDADLSKLPPPNKDIEERLQQLELNCRPNILQTKKQNKQGKKKFEKEKRRVARNDGKLDSAETHHVEAVGKQFGAFEDHTRGIGRKLLEQMGYLGEGRGLGRENQGMPNLWKRL